MKRLRKPFYIVLILIAVAGLVYTMKLDTSTPTVVVEEDVAGQGAAVAEVTAAQATGFTSIIYSVGSTQLHFGLDEAGQWCWMDNTSFPLNDSNIAQLAEALTDLKYLRSIPLEDESSVGEYGLEDPWGSLSAVRSDESTLMLFFGNESDAGMYYMLKDGDIDNALVYDAPWLELLNTPIYDMMLLPELPELTQETLQGLMVSTEATTTAVYPDKEGTTVVGWHLAGDEVVQELPELTTAVTQFALAKCFSFDPSEEAVTICGFDAPNFTITLVHGLDQEEGVLLNLYVGTTAMDEAYRYVRMDQDPTIYLVETAWIDAIVSGAEALAGTGVAGPVAD